MDVSQCSDAEQRSGQGCPVKRIKLGGKRGGVAIVDENDYERCVGYSWSRDHHGYAQARVEGKTKYLHSLINQTPKGYETDHINRNKLDNRKNNLRTVTRSGNVLNVLRADNQCGVRGVWYDPKTGRFCAMRHVGGRAVWLGRHETIEEAARAYKAVP